MNLSTFDFQYPKSLIAREPLSYRSASRLLVADRRTKEIHHTHFAYILDFLNPDDCLVVNNTKVIPARIFGKKDTSGEVEIVLLHEREQLHWQCIGRPLKRLKIGAGITFSEKLSACVVDRVDDDQVILKFSSDGPFFDILNEIGHMPLPPYIDRSDKEDDRVNYQTVFAKKAGASAAPTAGLHWDEDLKEKARHKGIEFAQVTLHVGLGTFSPIRSEVIENHQMHAEYFDISVETVEKINQSKRVVAVGTTTVRALESSASGKKVTAKSGWTNLFIYPGYDFKVVNAIQTNFHQPKSSLLVMVSAFAGTDFIKTCYETAISEKYRLFSYGDTMLIL